MGGSDHLRPTYDRVAFRSNGRLWGYAPLPDLPLVVFDNVEITVDNETLIESDFNDLELGPFPYFWTPGPSPRGHTRVIVENGTTATVAARPGRRGDREVVLDSLADSLATVSFETPVRRYGRVHLAWDSAILSDPVDPRREQGEIALSAWEGLGGGIPPREPNAASS
jgi:hypothetical protein